MDMTGEMIMTEVDPNSEDDVDILNYLHDIIYEFSSRRIKADPVEAEAFSISQDYEQFGGKVSVCFDSLIPLFNIKSITQEENRRITARVMKRTIRALRVMSERTVRTGCAGFAGNPDLFG